MSRIINPRPKNLREIYHDQLPDPYAPGDVKPTLSLDDRSKNISTKGDRVKDVSIGLIDIDSAISKYIDEKIQPSIIQDGERIKVPVMYGYPERWQTIQEKGYLREYSGKMLSPIIVFKRDSITANRGLGTKIDANNPQNFHIFEQSYTKRNQYDNFSLLSNKLPVKEFRVIVMPEYCTLKYSVIIFTNHLEQNNKIIEAFQYAANTYWGEENRFLFRANIDSYTTSTEYSLGVDRTTRTNFDITLNGYIIPDSVNRDISYPKKYSSKSQVVFNLETDQPDVFTANRGAEDTTRRQAVTFPTTTQTVTLRIDPAVLTYLNTNTQLLGTFVNNTTVTFASGWLSSPSPEFPTTSVDNFTFFCNGQFIEKAAISSFTEAGGVSTLVIDPLKLSYDFELTDEIIAIGKFNS